MRFFANRKYKNRINSRLMRICIKLKIVYYGNYYSLVDALGTSNGIKSISWYYLNVPARGLYVLN